MSRNVQQNLKCTYVVKWQFESAWLADACLTKKKLKVLLVARNENVIKLPYTASSECTLKENKRIITEG